MAEDCNAQYPLPLSFTALAHSQPAIAQELFSKPLETMSLLDDMAVAAQEKLLKLWPAFCDDHRSRIQLLQCRLQQFCRQHSDRVSHYNSSSPDNNDCGTKCSKTLHARPSWPPFPIRPSKLPILAGTPLPDPTDLSVKERIRIRVIGLPPTLDPHYFRNAANGLRLQAPVLRTSSSSSSSSSTSSSLLIGKGIANKSPDPNQNDAILSTIRRNYHHGDVACPTAVLTPPMGLLGATHVRRLVIVRGTVVRSGAVRVFESRQPHECAKCKQRFLFKSALEDGGAVQLPDLCPNSPCSGSKFVKLPDFHPHQWSSFQDLRLVDRLGAGIRGSRIGGGAGTDGGASDMDLMNSRSDSFHSQSARPVRPSSPSSILPPPSLLTPLPSAPDDDVSGSTTVIVQDEMVDQFRPGD
eukprot:CAMPEP_0175048148 /NCGR_PEP_ID=MMETSP0052_2-20121109/6007_1 /TAXON_ID=51329 ORGANISM="Polytomella parva, Strain SAG 63-3" /NCGR_SAMPLE_ID=MMETSP0052_2 /ASSEMBLY_ACC=CAM_ASM_000194 /LENGTH=409 /DNA_ID=CAMNT_0016312137 /DNA_START=240 /DNA_END=1466 /DNA_ORIENTATION=-